MLEDYNVSKYCAKRKMNFTEGRSDFMKLKKGITFVTIALLFILIIFSIVILNKNKSNEKTPIDHLINAINNNDITEIPKAFHEYCSLAIEQNISKEKFQNYIDGITQDMGGKFHISYKITNMTTLSKEDIEMYENIAKIDYSAYPYLSNNGDLKFENIYKVSTYMTIKGKYQEENGDVDFLVVKIDGKYYFLHTPNQMMYQFINY